MPSQRMAALFTVFPVNITEARLRAHLAVTLFIVSNGIQDAIRCNE